MRNWDSRDEAGGGHCTADEDYEDAQCICKHLGAVLCSLSLAVVAVRICTIYYSFSSVGCGSSLWQRCLVRLKNGVFRIC
jgi:hypothetical protein